MPATYDSIASVTLNGSSSTATFPTIAQTFTDLLLVVMDASTSGAYDTIIQFNGDTGANYSRTGLRADGNTGSSYRQTNLNAINLCSDGSANYAKPGLVHIMNYTNTGVNKSVLTRVNTGTTGTVAHAQLWRSTAAITQIEVRTVGGFMAAGSTVTLYGIKAA